MAEKKKSNFLTCLLVGCGGTILLVAIGVFGVYIYLKRTAEAYTQETAVEFPSKQWTDADRERIEARLKSFGEKIESGDASSLVLTQDEINALISKEKELADKVYVTIEGDRITGQICVKLDEGIPLAGGRYLNGEATFSVGIDDGELKAYVKSVEVNGKALPENFMDAIKDENLAADAKIDEKTRKNLKRVERLEVKGGKIVLVVKEGEPMEKAPDEGGPESEAPKKEAVPETIE
ncbi:MAG: hypothetical protein QF473_25115 [Planctomycetota bacterium]|jgi:hypothetical protein|nr:hypothetical protein [Planctomycetota bacterium]